MIRAVTFDFWNTVMWEEPGSLRRHRLLAWHEALAGSATRIDPDRLESAHDLAHARYEAAWRSGTQFRAADGVALMLEDLGIGDPAIGPLLLEGFNEGGRRAEVQPCPGAAECLTALKTAGARLGIICDIGLTPSPVVLELLQRHELLGLFDSTTFSDNVGMYKPDPAIFAHALGTLGADPADAAHVGDRRRTDIGGAICAGMTAVRYNGIYEDLAIEDAAYDAHIVLDQLTEIPSALAVG